MARTKDYRDNDNIYGRYVFNKSMLTCFKLRNSLSYFLGSYHHITTTRDDETTTTKPFLTSSAGGLFSTFSIIITYANSQPSWDTLITSTRDAGSKLWMVSYESDFGNGDLSISRQYFLFPVAQCEG